MLHHSRELFCSPSKAEQVPLQSSVLSIQFALLLALFQPSVNTWAYAGLRFFLFVSLKCHQAYRPYCQSSLLSRAPGTPPVVAVLSESHIVVS